MRTNRTGAASRVCPELHHANECGISQAAGWQRESTGAAGDLQIVPQGFTSCCLVVLPAFACALAIGLVERDHFDQPLKPLKADRTFVAQVEEHVGWKISGRHMATGDEDGRSLEQQGRIALATVRHKLPRRHGPERLVQ